MAKSSYEVVSLAKLAHEVGEVIDALADLGAVRAGTLAVLIDDLTRVKEILHQFDRGMLQGYNTVTVFDKE